jgi:hypothetical protein
MAMPADPSDRIRRAASKKSTEELMRFWRKQDRAHYSSASFEVVEEILKERGVSLESSEPTGREAASGGSPFGRSAIRRTAGLCLIVVGGLEVVAMSLYFAVLLFLVLGVILVGSGTEQAWPQFKGLVSEFLVEFWYLPALGVLIALSGLLVLLEVRYSEWIATVVVLGSALVLAISFL